MYAALGRDKSIALPLFHSFTGCDTTSTLFGKGKKSAWDTWNCYPDVTSAFTYMALNPYHKVDADDRYFQLLERFTVVLYDKTSDLELVDEARKEMYGTARKRRPWRIFHLPRMHYCSTQREQSTKQGYGAQVMRVNSMLQLQTVGAGLLMRTAMPGSLSGSLYLLPLKPAVSW